MVAPFRNDQHYIDCWLFSHKFELCNSSTILAEPLYRPVVIKHPNFGNKGLVDKKEERTSAGITIRSDIDYPPSASDASTWQASKLMAQLNLVAPNSSRLQVYACDVAWRPFGVPSVNVAVCCYDEVPEKITVCNNWRTNDIDENESSADWWYNCTINFHFYNKLMNFVRYCVWYLLVS